MRCEIITSGRRQCVMDFRDEFAGQCVRMPFDQRRKLFFQALRLHLLLNPTAVGAFVQINRALANDGAINWTGTRAFSMNGGTLQNNGSFTTSSALSAGRMT